MPFRSSEWPYIAAGSVAADPAAMNRGIWSDWLRDRNASEAVALETTPLRRLGTWDIWHYSFGRGIGISRGSGRGIGSGIGSGSGNGRGSGIGSGRGIGIGIGIGSGRGSGSGRGIGIGRGIGSGIGSGIGRGSGSYLVAPYREKQMEIGKSYLLHCGDWHTFVGRVAEQVGPYTYRLEMVSKISDTNNGDCWHELAAGNKQMRQGATYQHYTTPGVFPLSIAAFEWVGKLPQEEKR